MSDLSSLTSKELRRWYRFHVEFPDSCAQMIFILSLVFCGTAISFAFWVPHIAIILFGCQILFWCLGEILQWRADRNSQL